MKNKSDNTINNNKKEIKILTTGILILITAIVVVVGTAYAFFNYSTTNENLQSIGTGIIQFNFVDGASVSKGNQFPLTSADVDDILSKSFTISSHNTVPDGIKYSVYVVYGDNETGKTRLRDDVISFQFIPPADSGGFSTTLNNCSTPSSLTFENGKALMATGLVKDTIGLTTRSFTVKMFIDSSKINISSTTKRATNAEGNPSLADATSGTTTATRYMTNDTSVSKTVTLYPAITSQQGKIIYTTNEFSNSYYSFKIMIEAEEEIPKIICKRVTDSSQLNTETCNQGSGYCYDDGYYAEGSKGTTTITYGTAKAIGDSSGLAVGDAFDCDVDGTGYNQRFYYISDRWNPGIDVTDSSFDSNTAVLIYYSNTYNGTISNSGGRYAQLVDVQNAGSELSDVNQNWWGPVTAIKHLPLSTTWSNVELKSTTRAIIACDDGDCANPSTSTTGGGGTPQSFSYERYAARLITLPEVKKSGCHTLSGKNTLAGAETLAACNFLFERTKYATNNYQYAASIITENPYSGDSTNVYTLRASFRNPYKYYANDGGGVRPVIEVPKEYMQY